MAKRFFSNFLFQCMNENCAKNAYAAQKLSNKMNNENPQYKSALGLLSHRKIKKHDGKKSKTKDRDGGKSKQKRKPL